MGACVCSTCALGKNGFQATFVCCVKAHCTVDKDREKEGRMDKSREGGREGGNEGGREGGREGGKEGGREGRKRERGKRKNQRNAVIMLWYNSLGYSPT